MDINNQTEKIWNSLQGLQQAKTKLDFETVWAGMQRREVRMQNRWLWAAAITLLLLVSMNIAGLLLVRQQPPGNQQEIEDFAREYGFTQETNL
jgi:hypothetical protein